MVLSHDTTEEDTLQHEANNFRYSIFTHKYDTFFDSKIAGQPSLKKPTKQKNYQPILMKSLG